MEILAACALICSPATVGPWEYMTQECAQDVFYSWHEIPEGLTPAHCDGPECLPLEWADCVIVRRFAEGCK